MKRNKDLVCRHNKRLKRMQLKAISAYTTNNRTELNDSINLKKSLDIP